jgi:hypothetical protein
MTLMKKLLTVPMVALAGIFSVMILSAGNPSVTTNPASGKLENPLHIEADQIRSPGIFTLDHFKSYMIDAQPADYEVRLRGQFDKKYLPARLLRYERFLNPVSKNDEAIIDKNAHLNWYLIQTEREPIRTVSYFNQFGLQTIKIGQPVALLVPTEKIEPDSQYPKRLDHYKVYEVLSAPQVNKGVFLVDQFTQEQNVAYTPAYFAVPVEKVHNGTLFPINNPEDHIVFYKMDPKDWSFFRNTKDQFNTNDMKTLWSDLLGVPSHKLAWQ